MMRTREEKIKLLTGIQKGMNRNGRLKAFCRECLAIMDDGESKKHLAGLVFDPFASSTELFRATCDGVLDTFIRMLKENRRPTSKHEIRNGINYCVPIQYDSDEEWKPADENAFDNVRKIIEKFKHYDPQGKN